VGMQGDVGGCGIWNDRPPAVPDTEKEFVVWVQRGGSSMSKRWAAINGKTCSSSNNNNRRG
jgi:hypothetical protein